MKNGTKRFKTFFLFGSSYFVNQLKEITSWLS